jgi:hypothetical protein
MAATAVAGILQLLLLVYIADYFFDIMRFVTYIRGFICESHSTASAGIEHYNMVASMKKLNS